MVSHVLPRTEPDTWLVRSCRRGTYAEVKLTERSKQTDIDTSVGYEVDMVKRNLHLNRLLFAGLTQIRLFLLDHFRL